MIGHQNFQNGGAFFAPYNQGNIPQYVPPQQSQAQVQNNVQQQTTQYSSIVFVHSEEEARNYPVGLGMSVPFKNESQPYMYTKTMGFNQLEQPVFKKYKLIEESDPEPVKSTDPEVLELRKQIDELRDMIKTSINKSSGNKRQKEEVTND